jgi:medium-chain acyl-[acyl-carrier-protein] hydrolase
VKKCRKSHLAIAFQSPESGERISLDFLKGDRLKSAWFPTAGSNPKARLRLFCFHHAGGGASSFGVWPRRLPAWIEVVSCHLPGHEERLREASILQMDQLLDAILIEMRPLLNQPFALFGHSFGAMIAFYLTRRLRQNSLALPQRLFVSGCQPLHLPRRHGPIHNLPQEQFIEQLQRLYEPIPDPILRAPDMLALFARVLRADFTVLESADYYPEPPLACAISAYAGLDDAEVSSSCLERWSNYTTAQFQSALFPGGHLYYRSLSTALFQKLTSDLSASYPGSIDPTVTQTKTGN